MDKAKKFVIQILYSAKCFRAGDFFQNTLAWNLENTKELGDLVAKNGKNLILMSNASQNPELRNDLRFVSRLLGIGEPILTIDPNITPKLVMAFWDGTNHSYMEEGMAAKDATFIAKHIEEAEDKKILVINRYPNWTYRAKQKLSIAKNQNKIPTYDEAMDNAIQLHNQVKEQREVLTWRDDIRPINPDTGIEYTRDEQDERYELFKATDFNCKLWKAVANELDTEAS